MVHYSVIKNVYVSHVISLNSISNILKITVITKENTGLWGKKTPRSLQTGKQWAVAARPGPTP